MRRITYWLLSTISGVVLLFSYSTSTAGSVASGSQAPAAGGDKVDPSKGPVSEVAGKVVQTRWGPVQVEVAIQAHQIVAVKLLKLPTGAMDQFIAKRSIPTLIKETLAAQSADIDIVTTATYTSQGYISSLQSALDDAEL